MMKRDAFSTCHPAVNFMFFAGAMIFSVIFEHPAYIAASTFSAAVCCLSLFGRKGIKIICGMIPMWIILSLVNPLFNPLGKTILFYWLGRPYTLEALFYGMAIAGIFVSALLWFSCFNLVITTDKLFCLFGNLVPALTLLLVMVFRLAASLTKKAAQLAEARKAVGKGSNRQDSLRQRISDGLIILSSLTSFALEGSLITADSMRSRGYGCGKRNTFQIFRLTPRDIILLLIMTVLCLLTVLSSLCGAASAAYIPELSFAPVSWGIPVYLCYLLIPALFNIREELLCHNLISRI